MAFSKFLFENKENCKEIINRLSDKFKYVSILGCDVKGVSISAYKDSTEIKDNEFDKQQGFVVKMSNGGAFFEYSFDNFNAGISNIIDNILDVAFLDERLLHIQIKPQDVVEEEIKKDFLRESDLDKYTNSALLDFCKKTVKKTLSKDNHLVNARCSIMTQDVSKMFISKKKELTQNYTWVNSNLVGIYQDNGRMSQPRIMTFSNKICDVIKELPNKIDSLIHKGERLVHATQIKPGVYDVITDPSITGLIAHEAFGHGVEMDQFVKDRALAKNMIGKYVASPIVNMRDGASSVFI